MKKEYDRFFKILHVKPNPEVVPQKDNDCLICAKTINNHIPLYPDGTVSSALKNIYSNRSDQEKREDMSNLVHDIWTEWMIGVLDSGVEFGDGTVLLNAKSVKRWRRQIKTNYEDLSEIDKDKDRVIADEIMDYTGEK